MFCINCHNYAGIAFKYLVFSDFNCIILLICVTEFSKSKNRLGYIDACINRQQNKFTVD